MKLNSMTLRTIHLPDTLRSRPETDPIEIEGIQFGGGTCSCVGILTLLNTVCVGVSC